jgi:hypothetical protein
MVRVVLVAEAEVLVNQIQVLLVAEEVLELLF